MFLLLEITTLAELAWRFSGDANGYVGALDAASGSKQICWPEIFQAASGILQVAQAEGLGSIALVLVVFFLQRC